MIGRIFDFLSWPIARVMCALDLSHRYDLTATESGIEGSCKRCGADAYPWLVMRTNDAVRRT